MTIKTFAAESVSAALKLVRAEMGRDAIVLKTRELSNGPDGARVEVTACTDKPMPVSPAPVAMATPKRTTIKPFVPAPVVNRMETRAAAPVLQADDQLSRRLDQIETKLVQLLELSAAHIPVDGLSPFRASLVNADVPWSIMHELLAEATASAGDDTARQAVARGLLTERISSAICSPMSFKPGDRVLFAGPAGSGKTSALGKLAARLVFQEKQKVVLVTLDSVKVGALEEIQSYGDIIDTHALAFHATPMDLAPESIVLIDSPAFTGQKDQLQTLRGQVDMLKPTYRFAVYSALMRSSDVEAAAANLKAVEPTHLIMTMTDLTERWGGMLAATTASNLALAFVTNSPAGLGTLNVPDAALVLRALLTTEDRRG